MITLEKAVSADLDESYAIIDEGRRFQKEQGFVQWTEGYPNRETLENDIRLGKGYVLKFDGKLAAYLCLDFDGEPAYNAIDGAWRTAEPYGVVHRLAIGGAFRGQGLADEVFGHVGSLCLACGVYSLRADTDFPNLRMQHVLEKNGFVRCGTVMFQGSGKLAYDKILK